MKSLSGLTDALNINESQLKEMSLEKLKQLFAMLKKIIEEKEAQNSK